MYSYILACHTWDGGKLVSAYRVTNHACSASGPSRYLCSSMPIATAWFSNHKVSGFSVPYRRSAMDSSLAPSDPRLATFTSHSAFHQHYVVGMARDGLVSRNILAARQCKRSVRHSHYLRLDHSLASISGRVASCWLIRKAERQIRSIRRRAEKES